MYTSNAPIQGKTTQSARTTCRFETRYQSGLPTPGNLTFYKDNEAQQAWILSLSASGIGLLLDGVEESPLWR